MSTANYFPATSTEIDFHGQILADKILKRGLWISLFIAVTIGYAFKDMETAVVVYSFGLVVVFLALVPPMPYFRKNPITWKKEKSL